MAFTALIGSIGNIVQTSDVQKVINVLFIPYTISSILGLVTVEYREQKCKKKAKEFYYNALYYLGDSQEKVIGLLKKSIFYGGAEYEMIIFNSSEFDCYKEKLGYSEQIKPLVPNNKRLKKCLGSLWRVFKSKYGL